MGQTQRRMNNDDSVKMKKRTGRRFSWKLLFIFILFEIVFTAVTIPLNVFYGPFTNVRRTVVGAAMTTYSHQFIAKIFLSDSEIEKIQQEDSVEVIEQKQTSSINITNKHDDSIERFDISGKKFKGYLLVIHDPTRVKVGYTKKLKKEGQLTSQIAEDNDAIAAINGGGFTDNSTDGMWTGTGGLPIGLLMSEGQVVYNDIKNDNQKKDVVALTKNGVLLVGPQSLNELKSKGVAQAISFGPALVVDGNPTIKTGDGGWGIAPRTAIGQRKDGSILLLVIDGRQVKSLGATLREVQDTMIQYGAVNASNLDGGSSSTMYYNGEVINNPCDSLGERAVPSVIYVK
jgi:exopolysaccharide biosynthesis protein